jgi:hypothetical protein
MGADLANNFATAEAALDLKNVFLSIHHHATSDIGRIYIKGYLYPISYPKIAKKDIPLSFF